MKLLSPGHVNPKTAKTIGGLRVLNAILHLAPYKLSGRNVCPKASEGCAKACLNFAGRGQFDSVQSARLRKTRLLFEDRKEFFRLLRKDLDSMSRKGLRENKLVAVRLNGTSDLNWAVGSFISEYPNIQFYDYTKCISYVRRLSKLKADNPKINYHLTFSRSETNEHECIEALSLGCNVAVVFSGDLPKEYLGSPVVDGDSHDFRFLDPSRDGGYVIGLKAKGPAKRDTSGFVVQV